jgi:putative SOS response-associated peptidase YedK
MCYYLSQNQDIENVEKRFEAKISKPEDFLVSDYVIGFDYKNVPVILNTSPGIISTNHHWGLVPSWAKDLDFRKNTLNARIETIHEKPSFRNITQNRCLVIASSYFEWRWLDDNGRQKEKYQIFSQEGEIFSFAAIYSTWKRDYKEYKSFSIVTTEANEQMKYVHNHKMRMPVMLNKIDEMNWLNAESIIEDFSYPKYDHPLLCLKV